MPLSISLLLLVSSACTCACPLCVHFFRPPAPPGLTGSSSLNPLSHPFLRLVPVPFGLVFGVGGLWGSVHLGQSVGMVPPPPSVSPFHLPFRVLGAVPRHTLAHCARRCSTGSCNASATTREDPAIRSVHGTRSEQIAAPCPGAFAPQLPSQRKRNA